MVLAKFVVNNTYLSMKRRIGKTKVRPTEFTVALDFIRILSCIQITDSRRLNNKFN